MVKVTMKEKVLQFVEAKGEARRADIIRFIVDIKIGEGCYDIHELAQVWDSKQGKAVNRRQRVYRGYYSSAFSQQGGAYFLKGKNRLVKTSRGIYQVVREDATCSNANA